MMWQFEGALMNSSHGSGGYVCVCVCGCIAVIKQRILSQLFQKIS